MKNIFHFFVEKLHLYWLELLGEKCFLKCRFGVYALFIHYDLSLWRCVNVCFVSAVTLRRDSEDRGRTKLACLHPELETQFRLFMSHSPPGMSEPDGANYWYRIFRFWWIHGVSGPVFLRSWQRIDLKNDLGDFLKGPVTKTPCPTEQRPGMNSH